LSYQAQPDIIKPGFNQYNKKLKIIKKWMINKELHYQKTKFAKSYIFFEFSMNLLICLPKQLSEVTSVVHVY